MRFEWDEAKNRENIRKHRIDFADVTTVFDAPMLAAPDTRKDYGEDRWVGIGFLGPGIVVVIFVERTRDVIRIVSARKATRREREAFAKEIGDRLGPSGW